MQIGVSVVVPVYNVENFLERCLESLANQTYQYYEVILVDDGSTDKSGLICDEWVNRLDNFTVIHKKNGGLSESRNFGVNHAKYEYVMFLDSDDTITNNCLEILVTPFINNHLDIAITKFHYVYEDILNYMVDSPIVEEELMSGREILKYALLGEKGSLSSQPKLFKKELLLKNPFPVGKLYEDMQIIYNIFNQANKVSYIDTPTYNYLQRNNSIVHSRVTEKHLYGLKSCIGILNTELENYGELEKYIHCRIVNQACGHLPNLLAFKDTLMFGTIKDIVKPYTIKVIKSKITPRKLKIKAMAYLLPTPLSWVYCNILFNGKKIFRKMRNK